MTSSSKFHKALKRLSQKKSLRSGKPPSHGSPSDAWIKRGLQGSGKHKNSYEKAIAPGDRIRMIRRLMPEKRGENYHSQPLRWLDETLDICVSYESENLKLKRKVAKLIGRERRREAYAKNV